MARRREERVRSARLDGSLRATLERYELHGIRETGNKFAMGSYASVIEVDYKGMRCAAKKISHFLYDNFEGGKIANSFAMECCLMGELRHPHIVQFLGIYFDPATYIPVLVMEVLPVTLAECVDCYGCLPAEICYAILSDIALGLRYLHERDPPLMHRNLSANNVMLTRDMVAKISDLGVATLQINRTMTQAPGTLTYMPPEALCPNPRYDIGVDVFSFGVMMVHVLSGQWPHPSEATRIDPHNVISGVSEVERRAEYLDVIGRPSDEEEGHPLMALIERCLSNIPNRRPNASELVERMSDILAKQPLTIINRVDMMQRIDSIQTQEETGGTDDYRALVAQLKPYTRKSTPTGKVLGSGTYGSVIELISARETVAGKVFRMSSSVNLQAIAFRVCGELSTMMQLRHPNIVKCKGVSLLTGQPLPVLLMELMISSLHAYLLHPDNSNLSVERKVSILRGTASGLDYLHSQTPAIIHRDLTARNVLLDSQAVTAKISDFGNSRIMDLDPEVTPETLTSLPGTLEYMPPEAQGGSVVYDPSLDVFSFGHLSLFTVTQTPVQLLPATYPDHSTEKVHGRSEVKRRKGAVEAAEQVLSESHSLVSVMKQCLHNNPAQRPHTRELVTRLQEMVTLGSVALTHSHGHRRGPDNSPTEKSRSATGRHANSKPDMINLRKLSTHSGVINIMEETSTRYRDIGVILLKDTNGTIVAGIEKSARGEPLEAVHNIYARWIGEDVDYSWRKLAQCFRDCGLNVLASNIEKHFGLQQSTGPGTAVESRSAHPSSMRDSGPTAKSDQDFDYQFRLILLGDSGVGKSSIFCQFREGTYSHSINPTLGIDFCVKLIEVGGCQIKLQLWDTGGQERFRATVRAYYRDSVGGLLVFDITNRKSFANLSVWLEDVQTYAGPYKPVFILVGNKTDQDVHREVSKEEALSFATQHDMEYYETSARNGSDIEEVVHKLADKILTLVDGGLIKIEDGWKGVTKCTELSHTAHRNGEGDIAPIKLREASDDNQGGQQQTPRKRKRRCF